VTVLWVLLSPVVTVLLAALGELVSDEIRARLDRVPFALLSAAARRLPPGQREDMHDNSWLPELHHILRGEDAMPITRLVHGVRFALGLWLAVPRISRELEGLTTCGEFPVRVPVGPLNLLDIPVTEFEYLVRELFAKIGFRQQTSQLTADGGIDAIVVNDEPIVGGPCIVQVKRCLHPVSAMTVRELISTVAIERAARGVLVTTSSVTGASRDIAARCAWIEIIDGQRLKTMLREHLGLDAVITPPSD
jgi:Restriction endonuclease